MIWVFAYAELMGEHLLRSYDAQPARLDGYHRAFLHASTLLWGTPEHPGPRIGLAAGGECWGLAFRVPWLARRTMLRRAAPTENAEEYRRVRLPIALQNGGNERALVWITGREATSRVLWSDDGELRQALLDAHGTAGRGVEYVRTIFHALELWGLHDPLIDAVWTGLASWRPR
jgi:cation transport protein ChaC